MKLQRYTSEELVELTGHLALGPLVGNIWVPVWAVRPGSYRAIAHAAGAIPLWLALHSRNADYWKPAYASRETLGLTIGCKRAKITRLLRMLAKIGLLFEVRRGVDPRTRRHRAVARWALDPFTVALWSPKVRASLERVAGEDPQDGRWLQRALTALEAFERRSWALRSRLEADMPARLVDSQRKREGRRAKKRARKLSRLEPRSKMVREGMGFTREAGASVEVGKKVEVRSPCRASRTSAPQASTLDPRHPGRADATTAFNVPGPILGPG